MKSIEYQNQGSVLTPLKTWSFITRKPVTQPLEPRLASANYRGFHLNDWNLCIGCGTCQKVCDNAAITMVRIPDLPVDPIKGVRNQRPAIDLGRCCWCALCVDICPTGALALSREYVHTCTDAQISSYFFLPDAIGIHGRYFGHGWAKTSDSDLVDLKRQEMEQLSPSARRDNFDEIVIGYDDHQALLEASRCVQCGMCHDACPTHMNAPEYIRAIWEGRTEDAVRWIYETNPFAHVCGRVCTHRCETACSIGRRGEPVAIRWLKRYAMDAVPHDRIKQIVATAKAEKSSGRRVAIVGAGPAGLTAAFDLIKKGHGVTVFEAQAQPGGMPRWGIPEYRLPSEKLHEDIDVILSLGVELRCGTRIGQDLLLEDLQRDYDAVLIALGLQLGRSTRIPHSDHPQVYKSVDLLRRIRAGKDVDIARTIVVIGGGNVAMDLARTLARRQRQLFGAVSVTVTALEDFAHFLADPTEVEESRAEGIEIFDARGPQECMLNDQGGLLGLRTWHVKSIFDAQGRFAPSYDPSDERIHHGEMVVEAIGQMTDTSLLGNALTEKLEWQRGRLKVNDHGATSEAWLWAAGDMVRGPDVVNAVADGHRVASGIHAYLSQLEIDQ